MVLSKSHMSCAFRVLCSGGLPSHTFSAHNAAQREPRGVGKLVRRVGICNKPRNGLVDRVSVRRIHFQERDIQLLRRARESGDRYGVVMNAWIETRRRAPLRVLPE